nr:PREDICTED: eukaryotic translation initiation factor 4B2-like [Daucus carota subsp. sativus]
MSKPWGKIGAWAAEAEQAELEEKQQQAAEAAAAASRDSQSYPSLRETVNSKPKKKNKMSLQQFALSTGSSRVGLTPDEMLQLPKGPQERSGEFQSGRFGSFGRAGGSHRDDRRFDDDGRRAGTVTRISDYDQPSRADGVDNWAMSKRAVVNLGDRGSRNEGFSRGSGSEGVSRADEAGNWGTGKKVANVFDGGNRTSTSRHGALGSGGGTDGVSRADEVDNWAVGKKQQVLAAGPVRSSGFSGSGPDRWTRGGGNGLGGEERTKMVFDKPRTDRVVNESSVSKGEGNRPNPFGAARPREEVLSEKGLDWREVDMEIEAKKSSGSRPSSGQSNRPGSSQSEPAEGGSSLPQGVMKPKVNPFGDAKPRELLLEEKGLDWKKIDLDLERRRVDRPETEMEVNLKIEIDHLRREIEKESTSNVNRDSQQVSSQEQTNMHDRLLQKERELEQIARELDDKVRFVQKPIERPGSGSGRGSAIFERPPSRSGSYEDSRNTKFMQRPRSRGTGDRSGSFEDFRNTEYVQRPHSRGTGDLLPRQRDERRGFQGGKGFLGSRNVDRSSERW